MPEKKYNVATLTNAALLVSHMETFQLNTMVVSDIAQHRRPSGASKVSKKDFSLKQYGDPNKNFAVPWYLKN